MGWNGQWPTRTPSWGTTPAPGPGGNPPSGPGGPTAQSRAVNAAIWGPRASDAGNIYNEINNYARQIGGGQPGWTDAGIDAGVINQMLRTMPASDVLARTKAYYDQLKAGGSNPWSAFSGGHDTGQALVRSVLGNYRGTPDMTSPAYVQNRANWLRQQRAAEGLDQWGNPIGTTTAAPAAPTRRTTTAPPRNPPYNPLQPTPQPYTPPNKPPVM